MKHDDIFLGNIDIAPAAIELIISIATSKTKGVHHVQGNVLQPAHKDWLKRALSSKGVFLTLNEQGEFLVDVYVALQYGVSVPKLAKKIQERIKEQVLFMCDIEIAEVNVHITDLVLETGDIVE